MLRHTLPVVLATLVACPSPPDPTTTDATGDTGPAPTSGGQGRGSFLLELNNPWFEQGDPQTVLAGVFTDDPTDVANLAQCLFGTEPWCATALPAEGAQVDVLPPDPALRGSLVTLDAGPSVRLATYNIPRVDGDGFVAYRDESDTLISLDDLVLRLDIPGGDGWPQTLLPDTAPIPTPMVLTSHDPDRPARFYDADLVRIEWLTGASGDVHLWMRTEQGETLRRLPDTGSYTFDLQPLGLSNESLIDMRLLRSNVVEGLESDGGEVDLTVQYVERFGGVYYTIGERDDLTKALSDTCEEAEKADTVTEGFYTGTFASFDNDLDPTASGCTGLPATAPDAIIPVDVRPLQKLTARYHLLADDASIYLVTDCNEVATCRVGADAFAGSNVGGEEVLEWTNQGADTERVYLVLDGTTTVSSLFRLDLELSEIGGDILQNFCADAIEQGPVNPGFYGGTLADHVDVLPAYETKACKAPNMVGGEGVAEIYLEAGATLRATADTPGATPQLFLLSNCSVTASCFVAAEGEISWTNGTGFAQTFYVLLDSTAGIGEYALDVDIE